MKIKEVEECLQVPRATIRFYEKEGLINPKKGENGYREYSDYDILILKKIIVLRKLGFSVADIEDVLDRAKPLSEVVSSNITNLENQIEELQGALKVCRKLQEAREEIETFDQDKYWNVIQEEEKQGNKFFDIAKDVAKFEKNVILEYFGITDIEGNRLVSIPKAIFLVIISVMIFGLMRCYFDGVWNIRTFAEGIKMLLAIIILEIIVGIPIYFAGKKNPDVIKNRGKIKLIIYTGMLLLFVVLIMLLVSI